MSAISRQPTSGAPRITPAETGIIAPAIPRRVTQHDGHDFNQTGYEEGAGLRRAETWRDAAVPAPLSLRKRAARRVNIALVALNDVLETAAAIDDGCRPDHFTADELCDIEASY